MPTAGPMAEDIIALDKRYEKLCQEYKLGDVHQQVTQPAMPAGGARGHWRALTEHSGYPLGRRVVVSRCAGDSRSVVSCKQQKVSLRPQDSRARLTNTAGLGA